MIRSSSNHNNHNREELQSSDSSILSTPRLVTYKTFLINCSYCSVHRSKSNSKNNESKNQKDTNNCLAKSPASSTKQFLISFHPFSFKIPKSTVFLASSLPNNNNNSKKARSTHNNQQLVKKADEINEPVENLADNIVDINPGSYNNNNNNITNLPDTTESLDQNNQLNEQQTEMNKRCCLSVSVVPSDKQNGNKNKKSNKKNVNLLIFSLILKNYECLQDSL